MKKLIAGNWKMNGSLEQSMELLSSMVAKIQENPHLKETCEFLVCPPSPYIQTIRDICVKHNIALGAQDCSTHQSGAYTGEVAASMIRDCGGDYVILGHSERRRYHNETNELISRKAKAAHECGLITIICLGETEQERDDGKEENVVEKQLSASLPETATADNTIIAYEPVWAIGTGKTANRDDVAIMHNFIRSKLKEQLAHSENVRILYGGSMKADNAEALLSTPNVDGGLIGGASLKAEDFVAIGNAAP